MIGMALGQRGDTLIEVTFALAILATVLLGSTSIAASAFRMGQTAKERTVTIEKAQQQIEALRSFRDSHSWNEFRSGNGCTTPGGYCGVDNVGATWHMELTNVSGSTQWVPVTGSLAGPVPTSTMGISADLSTGLRMNARPCNYDFQLNYSFSPLGGGTQVKNQIRTRLGNLKFAGGTGICL